MIIRRMGCRIAEALSYLGVNCPPECSGVKEFCPEARMSLADAQKAKANNQLLQGSKKIGKFQGDLEAHKEIFLNESRVG